MRSLPPASGDPREPAPRTARRRPPHSPGCAPWDWERLPWGRQVLRQRRSERQPVMRRKPPPGQGTAASASHPRGFHGVQQEWVGCQIPKKAKRRVALRSLCLNPSLEPLFHHTCGCPWPVLPYIHLGGKAPVPSCLFLAGSKHAVMNLSEVTGVVEGLRPHQSLNLVVGFLPGRRWVTTIKKVSDNCRGLPGIG